MPEIAIRQHSKQNNGSVNTSFGYGVDGHGEQNVTCGINMD